MTDLQVQKPTTNEELLAAQEQQGEYLTFNVSDEKLGVNINEIKEIIEITNVTHVPMTPDYIRGVINLRGNVVPVIDLSARLSNNNCTISKRSCIVLVEVSTGNKSQNIGMLVGVDCLGLDAFEELASS